MEGFLMNTFSAAVDQLAYYKHSDPFGLQNAL